MADRSANRFQALDPVRRGVRQQFGAIGKDVAAGLKRRHDDGPNAMSNDFLSGFAASPSFKREPQGNGVAERFIRTRKEVSIASTTAMVSCAHRGHRYRRIPRRTSPSATRSIG